MYKDTDMVNLKNILDLSMACSDSKIYTTWSNLKHSSINKTISRHPSGNNNTIPNFLQETSDLTSHKRSHSLPDLRRAQVLNVPLNFSVSFALDVSEELVDHDSSSQVDSSSNHTASAMSRSSNDSTTSSNTSSKKLQNLSLVKLFMKQKSMSVEGMSLTLDQSDSEWPAQASCCTDSQPTGETQVPKPRSRNDFSINWLKLEQRSRKDATSEEVDSSLSELSEGAAKQVMSWMMK